MASEFRPSGVFVPLVTPLDDRAAVVRDAVSKLAEQVLAEAARGVVAVATTVEPT